MWPNLPHIQSFPKQTLLSGIRPQTMPLTQQLLFSLIERGGGTPNNYGEGCVSSTAGLANHGLPRAKFSPTVWLYSP